MNIVFRSLSCTLYICLTHHWWVISFFVHHWLRLRVYHVCSRRSTFERPSSTLTLSHSLLVALNSVETVHFLLCRLKDPSLVKYPALSMTSTITTGSVSKPIVLMPLWWIFYLFSRSCECDPRYRQAPWFDRQDGLDRWECATVEVAVFYLVSTWSRSDWCSSHGWMSFVLVTTWQRQRNNVMINCCVWTRQVERQLSSIYRIGTIRWAFHPCQCPDNESTLTHKCVALLQSDYLIDSSSSMGKDEKINEKNKTLILMVIILKRRTWNILAVLSQSVSSCNR